MTPTFLLAVFCGGGLGAVLRFAISHTWPVSQGEFPWATLGINIAGSFLIGLVWALYGTSDWFAGWGRAFIVTGLLGGFTTFSTFSLEFYQLVETGRVLSALAYAGLSVTLCVCAVLLAFRLN